MARGGGGVRLDEHRLNDIRERHKLPPRILHLPSPISSWHVPLRPLQPGHTQWRSARRMLRLIIPQHKGQRCCRLAAAGIARSSADSRGTDQWRCQSARETWGDGVAVGPPWGGRLSTTLCNKVIRLLCTPQDESQTHSEFLMRTAHAHTRPGAAAAPPPGGATWSQVRRFAPSGATPQSAPQDAMLKTRCGPVLDALCHLPFTFCSTRGGVSPAAPAVHGRAQKAGRSATKPAQRRKSLHDVRGVPPTRARLQPPSAALPA